MLTLAKVEIYVLYTCLDFSGGSYTMSHLMLQYCL